MKIFKFELPIKEGHNRPFLVAIPADKIEKVESQFGSENCYLVINGIEVKGSYNDFIKEFENYNP